MKRKKPNQKKYSNPSFKPQLKIRNYTTETFGYSRLNKDNLNPRSILEINSVRYKNEKRIPDVLHPDLATKRKNGINGNCMKGLKPCNYYETNYECCIEN